MELSNWFKGFEKGIAKLSEEQRETFFRECGRNCVQCGTLQIYKDLYEQAAELLSAYKFDQQTASSARKSVNESEHPDGYILAGSILYVIFHDISIGCFFQLFSRLVLSSNLECHVINLKV